PDPPSFPTRRSSDLDPLCCLDPIVPRANVPLLTELSRAESFSRNRALCLTIQKQDVVVATGKDALSSARLGEHQDIWVWRNIFQVYDFIGQKQIAHQIGSSRTLVYFFAHGTHKSKNTG